MGNYKFIIESNANKPVVSTDRLMYQSVRKNKFGKSRELEVGKILTHDDGSTTFIIDYIAGNGKRVNVIIDEFGDMTTLS